jgi:hypothetical protein
MAVEPSKGNARICPPRQLPPTNFVPNFVRQSYWELQFGSPGPSRLRAP